MDSISISKCLAEIKGTFTLVIGGCGSAIFAGSRVGAHGVAFAFGLSVLVGAHAFGHISGGHFNPAVTFGQCVAGRFPWKKFPEYAVSQLIGATLAGLVMWAIAHGRPGFDANDGFATNGYGEGSPDQYNLLSCFFMEVLTTFTFLMTILGATDGLNNGRSGILAPISIGFGLTLIHLISIPVTNTSVNPARSLGVAWFGPKRGLEQVWMFIVAPLIGAGLGGFLYGPMVQGLNVLPIEEKIEMQGGAMAMEITPTFDIGRRVSQPIMNDLENRLGMLERRASFVPTNDLENRLGMLERRASFVPEVASSGAVSATLVGRKGEARQDVYESIEQGVEAAHKA